MTRSILFLMSVASLLFGSSACLAQDPPQRTKTSMWKVGIEPAGDGKYIIVGSVFAIGDPVHETLTLHALIDGGVLPKSTTVEDGAAVQFIRGVLWNDDPCAKLLAEDEFSPLKPSFGVAWYLDFKSAQRQAKTGVGFQDLYCPLLGRSHFGDLQFLHGMADRDGVKAADTAKRMLAWANVAYRIALGDIAPRKPLKTDSGADALLSSAAEMSAMRLLRAKTESETRARAFGALLHMVQDSYARGHVSRVPASAGQPAGIIQFLSYGNQDSDKHAHDDSWRDGTDDLERTLRIPGAQDALGASTELVRRYKAREPWPAVESYLKNGPLFVRSDAKNSGPGGYE